jgi:hypothetical protein
MIIGDKMGAGWPGLKVARPQQPPDEPAQMHARRRPVSGQQRRVRHHAVNADSDTLFNLLTGPQLLRNRCETGDAKPGTRNRGQTTEFRTDFRGQFTQFGSPSPNGWPVQRSCSRVLGPGLVRKHQPRDSNLGSPASRDSRRPRRPIRRSTGPVALGDGAPHPGAPPMPRTPREAGASPVWVAKLELRDQRRRTQSPASGPQIRTPDQDRQPLSAEDSPGWPRPVRETRVRPTGGE